MDDGLLENVEDSLLNDLDDLSDVDDNDDNDEKEYLHQQISAGQSQDQGVGVIGGSASRSMSWKVNELSVAMDVGVDNSREEEGVKSSSISNIESAGSSFTRKNVLENKNLLSLLNKIREQANLGDEGIMNDASGIYDTIVSCNRHIANLSNVLTEAHASLCLAYKKKFPELEDLVLDPVKYKLCVKILQNEMDVTLKNEDLNKILNSNQVLTISVAGSTTSGRVLTSSELQAVNDCIKYIDDVLEVQRALILFVEEHMVRIAPNVSAIVGASIAARLVGLAGGIQELSRIPACNIQVLGQVKQSAHSRAGMASTSGRPHMGIISECELVSNAPSYLEKKVVKQVAAKISLAARCDSIYADKIHGRKSSSNANNGKDPSASGRAFREEILAKINKLQEPEKARTLKALPKPDLSTKKRRGGKKVRRMKERFETTDLQKQANKRSFNVGIGEYGDDAMGMTLGMLDSKDGGNLRQAVEKKKMRQANTKASRKKAAQMSRSNGTTSGLVSSMVFTPVQGLELVNPDAVKDRVKDANRNWFSQDAGFKSALPKK